VRALSVRQTKCGNWLCSFHLSYVSSHVLLLLLRVLLLLLLGSVLLLLCVRARMVSVAGLAIPLTVRALLCAGLVRLGLLLLLHLLLLAATVAVLVIVVMGL